jgi:hypothetical protein
MDSIEMEVDTGAEAAENKLSAIEKVGNLQIPRSIDGWDKI